MSVHFRDGHDLKVGGPHRWSSVVPMLLILGLIFLSPLIFDLSRWLSALVAAK